MNVLEARSALDGKAAAICRGCAAALHSTFVDLGKTPMSNTYLQPADLHRPELYYPLHAYVCDACFLVQVEAFEAPEGIFSDYAYFSSYSESWLAHGERFAAEMCRRYELAANALVLEIASNDGYLLKHFARRGVGVLGVEPAQNVASVAVAAGIPTIASFFGTALARELRAQGVAPQLIVANNVLAHVPDLHDFVAGIAVLLDASARATIEFPHLARLIENVEFDTIYHEHFSYFSLLALEPVLARHGLSVYDAEELPTHGGSLRLHVCRTSSGTPSASVQAMRSAERRAGLDRPEVYRDFAQRVADVKHQTLEFLLTARAAGATVAAYGAPAKGNTFLAYCGIRADLLSYTVDRSPHKQGRLLPDSHLQVLAPEAIFERKPDYVLVLPWNLADEIMSQMAAIREWGGRFVTAIPQLTVHP